MGPGKICYFSQGFFLFSFIMFVSSSPVSPLLFLGNPSESAYPSITEISEMKHPLGIGQAIFFNNTILVLKPKL